MTILLCALKCEAEMLIKHYNLKRTDTKAFSIYTDENEKIILVITGVGKINAANAMGFIAGKYDIDSGDSIINFGTAALKNAGKLKMGDLVLGNKITDLNQNRDFYPDMLINTSEIRSIKEGTIYSSDHVIAKETLATDLPTEIPVDTVIDMEASSFFRAANSYIGAHQMHFLKIISDNGIDQATDYKALSLQIEKIITEKENEITAYIDLVCAFSEEKLENVIELSPDNQILFERMSEALKCSLSMERELYQLFIYKESEKRDIRPYFAEYELRELLPCKSKREGKVLLDEIRRNMLK